LLSIGQTIAGFVCDPEGLPSAVAAPFAEGVLSASIATMVSWLFGALAVLLLMAFLGALPGLSWYGTVVRRGPALKSRLALTFDDGPHPETTRQVLALLGRFQASATFFVTAHRSSHSEAQVCHVK